MSFLLTERTTKPRPVVLIKRKTSHALFLLGPHTHGQSEGQKSRQKDRHIRTAAVDNQPPSCRKRSWSCLFVCYTLKRVLPGNATSFICRPALLRRLADGGAYSAPSCPTVFGEGTGKDGLGEKEGLCRYEPLHSKSYVRCCGSICSRSEWFDHV